MKKVDLSKGVSHEGQQRFLNYFLGGMEALIKSACESGEGSISIEKILETASRARNYAEKEE